MIAQKEPLVAEIFIDGEPVGRTPAELVDLEPGRHTLKLVCDGYRTMTRSVVLATVLHDSIKVTLFPR